MRKSITRDEWSVLILFLAIFLGTFMRFNPTWLAGFAINDGGMFAIMIEDLKASHYSLPAFTTYNHSNIPFAYPPLGFYLGRIAADLSGASVMEVLRWLPAFFASLSIPAFYWLALRLFKDKYRAALSTLFFALMPRALSWFVMGGGLTRSPGQFFMLLALACVVRLYEENRRVDIWLTALFSALAVLSHPEAAVHTFVSALFLWIMLSRKRTAFIHAILVGLLVIVLTAPWWLTVVHYHGITPLLNAAATGKKLPAVFHLVFFVFTEEPYATFIAVLGLIGVAGHLVRKNYLLPLWMAIPFFVEGRSAAGPAAIPLAMLAAVGWADVIMPRLTVLYRTISLQEGDDSHEDAKIISSAERNIFIYLLLYLVFSTYQFGYRLSNATLYPADQEAMQWVKENTSSEARFLVLTGTTSVSCDSVLEWFPALSGRKSLYTVQGAEWTLGEGFTSFAKSVYNVQACLDEGASCLDAVLDPSEYDYVYVSKILRTNNCLPLEARRTFPYFIESMRSSERFEIVYETDGVVIYRKR